MSTDPNSPLYTGGMAFPVTLTDSIYLASLQPAVAALMSMQPDGTRESAAKDLATQGYTIDVPIQAWGWDATLTMALRKQYGYTWVPSALQPPVALPPGLSFPGLTPYDANNPPPGSILVSVDAADYPPFIKPVPPPPPSTNLVGPKLFGNVFTFGPGVSIVANKVTGVSDGQRVEQDGAAYTAHVNWGLMGVTVYFTLG